MDMEAPRITTESIETAILQFYRDPSNERVNSFLTQAQFKPEAWYFSWELLKTDKPYEVQYYGANTLHLKLSRHWNEISEDSIPSLRDNLLRILESHSGSSRAIVTKICVCLSCFILQTMMQHWPNALGELIASAVDPCGGDIQKKSIHQKNMLEILTVIPEEFQDMNETRKSQLLNALINGSNLVLPLIHRFLVEDWSHESVKNQALKCLTSWLHLSNICVVRPETEPLVFLLFDLVRSPTYFNDAAESLIQLFKIEINKKHPRTVVRYLKKVTELNDLFDSESHDMDVTQSLTKIFVSAAENNTSLILNSLSLNNSDSQIAIDLLRLIVKTISTKAQYPTEELCSDISFGFWYNFQDEIDNGSIAPHVNELLMSLFLDMFDVMTCKTKYPSDDEYSRWGLDDKEVFRCYRQDFADAAAYFSNFVGSECMDRMFVLLTNQLTNLHNNINVDWQEFDAIIYMMTSIMEGGHISLIDSTVKVFSLLPHVPCTHPKLITQIMFFIGSCAEVMDESMFKLSIDFILKGLVEGEILSAASMSLKDLLSANKAAISLVSDMVLRSLKQAMDRNDMESSDYVRLANCLGYVLIVVPQDHALQALDVILTPHVSTLFEVANNTQLSVACQNVVVDKLRLLAGFFSSFTFPENANDVVSPDHFIFQFIGQLLPGFKHTISMHIQDEKIMNELFEVLKRSVRSLIPFFQQMLPAYCELICISYDMNPLPCILEVAKSAFLGTMVDGPQQDILNTTFISICNKSLQILEPQNNPDVVEAFMIFLNQISKKIPYFVNFEYESVYRLFCAAVVGIGMKESLASKSSCQFMSSLILNANLTQVIQIHGRDLLQTIVLGVAVNLPRHNLNPLADVISALLIRHFEFVARTLSEILSVENFPTAKSTSADKQQFLKNILSSVKCKRRIKETLNEFAMLWRGFLNTEYGAQTAYRD